MYLKKSFKVFFVLELCLLEYTVEPAMISQPCNTGKAAFKRRYICIQNDILGNGQVASHRRLAVYKSGCS